MLHSPIAQVSTILAVATTAWAMASGRWPERTAAAYYALDWLAGVLFQDHRPHHHLQAVSFAFDFGEFLLLVFLVVASRRTWVMWGAALAFLLTITHLTVALDPHFDQWSYLTATYVWSLGLTVALAAGVALEGRRPAPLMWRPFRALRPSTPSATARSRS